MNAQINHTGKNNLAEID